MHMEVAQHWGSLFHLTLKEVQEDLVVVSDQTLILLVSLCYKLEGRGFDTR
jgi:hypothetical protein